MRIEGIHHISSTTADAVQNVDFYARVLGLRMVKQTVNQDEPSMYHVFFSDAEGSAGADMTFFEFPGAYPGMAGAGMIHTIVFRVANPEALDFWAERLASEGIRTQRDGNALAFRDPEGLGLEFVVSRVDDAPLIAHSVDVPDRFALQGFDAVRAFVADVDASERFAQDAFGMTRTDNEHEFEARGESRGGRIRFDQATRPGRQGAGTVHHVAWASPDDEHQQWRQRAVDAGAYATPVIDRFWFDAVYFREPGGILYEVATLGPGFTADESLDTLGQRLTLPPKLEPLREQIEHILTPLPDASQWQRTPADMGN